MSDLKFGPDKIKKGAPISRSSGLGLAQGSYLQLTFTENSFKSYFPNLWTDHRILKVLEHVRKSTWLCEAFLDGWLVYQYGTNPQIHFIENQNLILSLPRTPPPYHQCCGWITPANSQPFRYILVNCLSYPALIRN